MKDKGLVINTDDGSDVELMRPKAKVGETLNGNARVQCKSEQILKNESTMPLTEDLSQQQQKQRESRAGQGRGARWRGWRFQD